MSLQRAYEEFCTIVRQLEPDTLIREFSGYPIYPGVITTCSSPSSFKSVAVETDSHGLIPSSTKSISVVPNLCTVSTETPRFLSHKSSADAAIQVDQDSLWIQNIGVYSS
ncbi:hypothetical protein GEMRC1_011441 [Eukaryota sp. GEM-RC1]